MAIEVDGNRPLRRDIFSACSPHEHLKRCMFLVDAKEKRDVGSGEVECDASLSGEQAVSRTIRTCAGAQSHLRRIAVHIHPERQWELDRGARLTGCAVRFRDGRQTRTEACRQLLDTPGLLATASHRSWRFCLLWTLRRKPKCSELVLIPLNGLQPQQFVGTELLRVGHRAAELRALACREWWSHGACRTAAESGAEALSSGHPR